MLKHIFKSSAYMARQVFFKTQCKLYPNIDCGKIKATFLKDVMRSSPKSVFPSVLKINLYSRALAKCLLHVMTLNLHRDTLTANTDTSAIIWFHYFTLDIALLTLKVCNLDCHNPTKLSSDWGDFQFLKKEQQEEKKQLLNTL